MPIRRSAVACFGLAAIFAAPAFAGSKAPPSDDSLTCPQIAMELKKYMGPMMPNLRAVNGTNQQLLSRAQNRIAQRMPVVMGETAAATASHLDPTGAAGLAVGAAAAAQQQVWFQSDLAEDKPLADQQLAQMSAVAAQGQQLQADPRVQHLLQLAQAKGCTH